jgi:hypothetical protein
MARQPSPPARQPSPTELQANAKLPLNILQHIRNDEQFSRMYELFFHADE